MRGSRIARVALGIFVLLLGILLILAVIAVVAIRRPFPTTSGTLTIAPLDAEVEIRRDELGIPHIYAQSEHDLFVAQGYIHAQDRFWQMEFWRHVSQGRLAEMLGESLVESDTFIRTMGWPRLAQTTVDYYLEQEPEYYALVQSYADGVNAYIEDNRDALSVNLTILGLVNEPWEIEPWAPLHTIGWGVVMSDDLSGNWSNELRRLELIQALGEEKVAQLFPPYPYADRPVIVPTSAMAQFGPSANVPANLPPLSVDWSRIDTRLAAMPPAEGFAFGTSAWAGSNNWVVSGDHTQGGMPLLANDPHLAIQMPAIWYEVGLHAPTLEVAGLSFAGVPGIIIGHNRHIAWGVTNLGPDVQDLYIERINPDNPLQYEYMGEWRDMEVVEERIKVNGGEDVLLEVRSTRHGPIINEVIDGEHDVLAMRWTAQEPSRVLESVMRLNRAANYADFREAMRLWDIPSQNVVYADIEGNIAYQAPGLIPIRKNGNGQLPVPGWTDEYEWVGWIPFEEMPALLNPDTGYIVTANHAVVDEQYPYLISRDWADGDRGLRITNLVEQAINAGPISITDFGPIQADSKSLRAERLAPAFAQLSSDDPQVQAAIDQLNGWDLQERRDSVPAALFEIFYMHLVRRALVDDVGDEDVNRSFSPIFFHQLSQRPNDPWWDDTTTSNIETRDDMILLALQDTVQWFEDNSSGEMAEWTWGSIHTATFVSDPLGQSGIGLIESLVNRGPYAVDGSGSIVNATSWSWSSPAQARGIPSMRLLVDLSDFDASQIVIPTGQSGHPYHPHYDDQIEMWAEGTYQSLWFSRDAVEAATVDTLRLVPDSE